MRAFLFALAISLPAAALTVEEVTQLADAGVAEDIILEQLRSDGSVFELSAREIVDLQKKKVPPAVIKYMVTSRGKAPAKSEGKPAPAPKADVPKGADEERDAVLTVRNLGKGIITVLPYVREREIALVQGEITSGTVLMNGSHAEIKVPSGLYRVRWANEESFREIAVAKNVTTELEFREDERAWRGIRAVAITDGKEEPDPNAPRVVTPPTREEEIANPPTRVYQSPTNSSVTVIRDIQQVPTRVVIVPGNSCSSYSYDSCPPTYSYLSDDGYYSSGYYSRPRVSVGFSFGSSWSHGYSHYSSPSYYHGGHSWDDHGGHHYNRVADNIQYYLRWPFGHRHR
ncbi:MAG: hypothetical protein K8T20_10625 [Planctomycetes bacterium]|nr:hypothetical protein [Planctomycetota bacterium]